MKHAQRHAVDLSVSLGRMRLANPIVTVSGTCGYGPEYAPFLDLSQLGAFTTKSITPQPRIGNDPPRVVETSAGMLNAIGLANVGLEAFLAEKLPLLPRLGCPVWVNVAGHSIDDYVAVCRALDPRPEIAGLELNVSCPNVCDGLTFGTDASLLTALVSAVRREVRRCLLIVKLSPNVTDIAPMARAAVDAGADALSVINTLLGMAVDVRTRQALPAHGSGGLSGPAIKPVALYLVSRVFRTVARDAGVPIVGMGGVQTWQDAVEFLLAGATAVGVGTALFVDPAAPLKIRDGLAAYLADHGLASVRDLIGQARFADASAPAAPSAEAAEAAG
jgi:dihydroorotate dehydrogenase (NAD+) catalytic subunit